MKKGQRIILTKESDDKFKGSHPNGITEGFALEGDLMFDVVVGECLEMYHLVHDNWDWFHTSTVTEIVDENTIKTKNSTYKIEYIKNDKDGKTETRSTEVN